MPESPRHRPIDQGGKVPPAQGETIPARGEKHEPRLPHERDESATSEEREQPSQAEVGEQAYEDIERGLVDTGRGPVSNRVYKDRLKKDEPPAPDKA
ncbi:MAG: hypothetical protein ACLGHY_10525 [Gammaproteobacteria bacterium]